MDCRLLLLVTLSILPTNVVGLKCTSCTYLNTSFFGGFLDDKCTRPIKEPTLGINEELCAPSEGKIARCSLYKGSVDVDWTEETGRVSLQFYSRGCYYSLPENVPADGCLNRDKINEDKSILQQIMAKVHYLKILSFKGNLCLCSDSYCQISDKTSGSSSEFGLACLVLSVLSVLCVLLMY